MPLVPPLVPGPGASPLFILWQVKLRQKARNTRSLSISELVWASLADSAGYKANASILVIACRNSALNARIPEALSSL